MSLQDPTKKMSKSDPNPKASISLLDTPDQIMKKFKSAVTDSEAVVRRAPGKDGINNLLDIYTCCTGKTLEQAEAEFAGKGYGDFKTAVAQAVIEELRPMHERFARLNGDKAYLEECMKKGAESASRLAQRTLSKCMKKIGFKQI
jgi:tryptophanyl-tRNA synthetase